jgi:polar amino acid transport system substrate-binding protein
MKIMMGLMIVFCLSVSAQEKPLLQVRTISVSPYGIESNLQLSGVYYDLTNKLLDRLNIERKHYIYPYARIIQELKTGETDLTIMFKYKELIPHVRYISPLPALKNVVIGKKNTNLSSISDLNGKSIAYLRGAKFSDGIDNNKKILKYDVNNFTQGILMLKMGRVDGVIGPLEPIYNAAKVLKLEKDFFGKPLVVSERVPWLQISKKSMHKVSISQLENSFTKIMSEGELAKIKAKYRK